MGTTSTATSDAPVLTYQKNLTTLNPMDLLLNYWAEIILALMTFAKVIVNLPPTEVDNKVFGWLDVLINAIVADRRKERKAARQKRKKA